MVAFVATDGGFGAIYDLATNRRIATFAFPGRRVEQAFLDPAHDALVLHFEDGEIRAYRTTARVTRSVVLPHEMVARLQNDADGLNEFLQAAPDGQSVALADPDKGLWLWRGAQAGLEAQCLVLKAAQSFGSTFVSPSQLAVWDEQGARIVLLDSSGVRLSEFPGEGGDLEHVGTLNGLFAVKQAGVLTVIDRTGAVRWKGPCDDCAVGGSVAAFAYQNRLPLRILNLARTATEESSLDLTAERLSLDNGGGYVATVLEGVVTVVDLANRHTRWTHDFTADRTPRVTLGRDGTRIVVRLINPEESEIWDTLNDRPIAVATGNFANFAVDRNFAVAVGFSADSDRLRFYRLDNGAQIGDEGRHESNIERIRLSADGAWAVVQSQTAVSVWNVASGRILWGPATASAIQSLGTLDRKPTAIAAQLDPDNAPSLVDGVLLDSRMLLVAITMGDRNLPFPKVHVVDMFRPTAPAPDWLPTLAEALVGVSVTTNGDVVNVSDPNGTQSSIAARLRQHTAVTDYTIWGRWVTGTSPVAFARASELDGTCAIP